MSALPAPAATPQEPDAPASPRLCLGCGCSLEGLNPPVCPECGAAVVVPISPPQAPPLGDRAAAGFLMMVAQSLATRVVGFAGQVVLAALLAPDAFGLMALANSVLIVAGLAQQFGIREALMTRQAEFERWVRPAFWMCFATGAAACGAMAGSATLLARLYGEPRLAGLIVVLAVSTLIASLAIVPEADMQRKLRFRFMAMVTGATGVSTTVLMVVFALLHFGAYSFVLPRVIVGLGRLGVVWYASGLQPGWMWQMRRWRALAGASLLTLAANVLSVTTQIVDVTSLGIMLTATAVGFYGFAYSLSIQTIITISQSLAVIMLPTLAKLAHDAARLRGAFVKTTRALAAKLAPICALQLFAAEPAIHAVFGDKWDPAIVAVQALAPGVFLAGTFSPVASLLQSQGRFKRVLKLYAVNLLVCLALVPVGALLDGVRGAAIGESLYLSVCGLNWGILGMRPLGVSPVRVFDLAFRPALLAVVAAGGARALSLLVPQWGMTVRQHAWVQLGVIGPVCIALYLPMLRTFMPEAWKDVWERGRAMLVRVRLVRPA